MKCSKCGFEFAEGIFCPECGTKNDLNELVEEAIVDDSEDEEEIADIDKAMEDILFYYEQSGKRRRMYKGRIVSICITIVRSSY